MADSLTWQERFCQQWPQVQGYLWHLTKALRPQLREELRTEVTAKVCSEYAKLCAEGRPDVSLVAVVRYAWLGVANGRRLAGRVDSRDVLSDRRNENRPQVQACPDLQTALTDREPSAHNKAIVSVDFSEWIETLPELHKRIIALLADGNHPDEVAVQLGYKDPCVIYRIRDTLEASYYAFQGEPIPTTKRRRSPRS